ncbi:hypothetical protein LIA77_06359 [Sarocladium implicatum]|nr:hypothetical protein LIA77_06359 [Sarocladium implicatum]
MSGGWNPITGHDGSAAGPPAAPYGGPVPGRGQPYIHHYGGPSSYYTHGYLNFAGPYSPHYYGQQLGSYGGYYGAYHDLYQQQQGIYHPNGAANIYPRQNAPWPQIDTNMPASQMTNASGGLGCEPGYNYFFPPEHTKVHVYRSEVPPWQLPAGAQLEFTAAHLPCNITCADLLKGYGCTNENKKKNNCFEILPAGGGKWYKGLKINGADKGMMAKTVKELGWDQTRTGLNGEKPVVCLWFSKG